MNKNLFGIILFVFSAALLCAGMPTYAAMLGLGLISLLGKDNP